MLLVPRRPSRVVGHDDDVDIGLPCCFDCFALLFFFMKDDDVGSGETKQDATPMLLFEFALKW